MPNVIKQNINYLAFNYAKYSNLFANFKLINISVLNSLFNSLFRISSSLKNFHNILFLVSLILSFLTKQHSLSFSNFWTVLVDQLRRAPSIAARYSLISWAGTRLVKKKFLLLVSIHWAKLRAKEKQTLAEVGLSSIFVGLSLDISKTNQFF